MKTLNRNEISLFENLASLTQDNLRMTLYGFLKKNYEKVVFDNDFLLAKGDIPIAVVAHMDTVFKAPPTEIYYDRRKNVMWSPTGLGADDRAGVFSILQLIKAGYRPHVIFTTDEEIGCVGAQELSFLPCPFEDLRYIIQLDRRNSNDCVFYDCANAEFEKYVESFGFVTAWGSFTDICELCPSWGIAGVNLSIGYRDEHTTSEVLFVGQMIDTIEKVKKMLSVKDIPSFKFIPSPNAFNYWYDSKMDSYYDYFGDEEYLFDKPPIKVPNKPKYICKGCGGTFPEDEVLPVKLIRKGKIGYFCSDCMVNNVDWCFKCGEPFQIDPKDINSGYCVDCKKKKKG